MKLKYYLRGIGFGIIFATIIMMVSSFGNKTKLSKEEIIVEATKLGMIMPSTQSEQLQDSQQQENERNSELAPQAQSQVETPSDSQTQQESSQVEESGSEKTEIVLEKDWYQSSHGGLVTIYKSEEHPTTEILINIKKGATSEDVSEVLYECGYVESVDSFNIFMTTHAYNRKVLTGDKIIQAGATYEEIAHILLTNE